MKQSLDILLANLCVLSQKFRKAHWNLQCEGFAAFHSWLGSVYDQLNDKQDAVAERSRQLGYIPIAALSEFVESSKLSETGPDLHNFTDIITILSDDVKTTIHHLNSIFKENPSKSTDNFLASLLEELEKLQWFLNSHKEQK